MSNYPVSLDDDVSLPRVENNITEIGDAAINALRDAVFNIEAELGTSVAGTATSLAQRLSVAIDPAGNIRSAALTGLGLVTLPIFDSEISAAADIKESKLKLDYKTADLYNLFTNLNNNLTTALNFISNTGSKVEPHLQGATYRHFLTHIDISPTNSGYFKNNKDIFRDNTNLYTLINEINSDYVAHQNANGTSTSTVPPDNYAHVAAGINISASGFNSIPQTTTDLQKLANYLDSAGILTIGSRIQTLYQNGIPRSARASVFSPQISSSNALDNIREGQKVVPVTTVTTYLSDGSSSPVDNIDTGDDIIEFTPSTTALTNNLFDSQFAAVKTGDIISINYGNVVVPFIVKESKYVVSGSDKRFLIRINGKNLSASASATARIDRSKFNTNKYGELALAAAQFSTGINNSLPSLIVGSPRGAQTLGINFNSNLIDSLHYNLYLALYPTGNPADGIVNMFPVDISGNSGITPGSYTLDSIIQTINDTFRRPGYNYRFIAFSYQGEIGIMLADSYNNASFSIIAGILGTSGTYDQSLSNTAYPSNAIDVFNNIDPLGFGPANSNVASPPFTTTFSPVLAAQTPTRLIVPLANNTYFVDGVEKETLNFELGQTLDSNNNAYWPATITNKLIIGGARVETTYTVSLDLSASGLKVGKTIVVQQGTAGTSVDFGRFFIKSIQFSNCDTDNPSTDITVYDAVHATGISPYVSSGIGTAVRLYFSNDSVGFNIENSTDVVALSGYKRHFEIYVDKNGSTFSHERGRLSASSTSIVLNSIPLYASTELTKINIVKISPKLRGYAFSNIRKINLQITSYNITTGIFSGFLCKFDGTTVSNQGPVVVGKKGQVVRFYDETNVDYIDFSFDINDSVTTISLTKNIDIQLFPTLSLDDDIMLLGTCQVNDLDRNIKYLKDERQFGNVSEHQFSTSALDYISTPISLLNENGIIKGFDIVSIPSGASTYTNTLTINGGTALVNGKIININNQKISVPVVQEYLSSTIIVGTITWFLCANERGELEFIASTDFDPTTSSSTYDTLSLDHNRIFNIINPNNSLTAFYPIRATYLNDLIAKQKDVTLIGILTTTVSLVSSTYVISSATFIDARRFMTRGLGGLEKPFVFGTDGNFRTFESLNNWLNQLTKYKSSLSNANSIGKKVIVKGPFNISTAVTLDYNEKIIFEGDSGTFNVSSAIGFNVLNNVEFNNIRFNYNYDTTSDTNYTSNTDDLVHSSRGLLYTAVNTNKNISVKNCDFYTSSLNHYPFISFEYQADTSSLQNVEISKNKFFNTAVGNDKRAVIAFKARNVVPASATYNLLVNCFINENVCDKDQLISLSADYNSGAQQVYNAISTVNTIISKNICGAINFINRSFNPSSSANTSLIYDKNNSLIIENNTCKFIYTGLNDGIAKKLDNGSAEQLGPILLTTGVFSGSVFITKNTCSWIQVGFKVEDNVSIEKPAIILEHNKLNAFISTYLTEYYDGLSGIDNTALIIKEIEAFSVPSISNVIINSNVITWGYRANFNNNSYTAVISTNSDCIITNNIIAGIVSDSVNSYMLVISGTGSCQVKHNKFIREGNSVKYYINVTSTADQIITDNFFDNYNTDGSSTVLTNGLSSTSVYERNRNQTAILIISLHEGMVKNFRSDVAADTFSINATETQLNGFSYGTDTYNSTTLKFRDTGTSDTNGKEIIIDHSLNKYLPIGTKVTQVKVGMYMSTGSVITSSSKKFTLSLSETLSSPDILDVKNNNFGFASSLGSSSYIINSAGQLTNIQTSTQYITLNPTSVIKSNTTTWIEFEMFMNDTTDLTILVSPLVVTYRW